MTATITRHEVEIDTQLADASEREAKLSARREGYLGQIHDLAGDERVYRYVGRRRVAEPFKMTDAEALDVVRTTGAVRSYDQYRVPTLLASLDEAEAGIKAARATIRECDAAFEAAGGWARFFIVEGGHIHSSMHCSTCNNGEFRTRFGWMPALSGLTEAEAVAEHGAILCTVCYPSAPVEWTNGHEVAAEARKAAQCAGSGTYNYEARNARRVSRYEVCNDCKASTSVTSTGKLRAHKPAAK